MAIQSSDRKFKSYLCEKLIITGGQLKAAFLSFSLNVITQLKNNRTDNTMFLLGSEVTEEQHDTSDSLHSNRLSP